MTFGLRLCNGGPAYIRPMQPEGSLLPLDRGNGPWHRRPAG